ncbi:SA1362 family protein [Virgibacillus siamensis]|uniref:SA1362 family protein n=1 Tax=Virgibacillus siamensis TaxID=480071 RepID=UPI0009865866|nr:SA1362 family protein [Virgibacillus siamensis]
MQNKFSIVVYTVIGLAVIGVVSQLFTNTVSFLTTLLLMLVFGAALSALVYFLLIRKRTPSSDSRKFKKAVKQSKAKYAPKNKKPKNDAKRSKPLQTKKRKHKRASHLRVIDGNKSKRKDRATF